MIYNVPLEKLIQEFQKANPWYIIEDLNLNDPDSI